MFDPEVDLDPRMAAEFGVKPSSFISGPQIPFLPKIDCDEQELKYRTDSFQKIADAIHNANNRRIDKRAWTSNPYLLVTLNLDTVDRQLALAGYSLRVRFAYNPEKQNPVSSIDMCIKTSLDTAPVRKLFDQTRGEWEASLNTLKPSLNEMIDQNRLSQRALPKFFQDGHLRDDDFFVESVGATMRNVYPSFEKFQRNGKTHITVFQHTEDWKNIFMTPYADMVLSEDSEAEAEFLGFYNMTPDDINAAQYEKLMRKSMRLLDRVIMTADRANISQNPVAKSVRARNALETVYGPSPSATLSARFDYAARVHEASLFALSQKIRPEDINLNNILHHAGRMQAQVEGMKMHHEDTFRPAKYHL